MSTTTFEHVYEARASCELFRVALPPPGGVPIKASKDFEARVSRLPNASSGDSDELLEKWMMDYGTHYASSVVLGGMVVLRWTLTKSSYSTYQEEARKSSFSVETGVESAFSSFTTGTAISKEDTAANAFEEALEGKKAIETYLGGASFVKDDLAKWADGLKDDHALVGSKQFELQQITDLLTPLNFPGLGSGVQATAEEFFGRLCTPGGSYLGHDKCTPNAADPPARPVILPITIATGSEIWCVTWARDGAFVATGDQDAHVRTWNVITGKADLTLSGAKPMLLGSVAYSPDGKHLASGSQDYTIRIWDTTTGQSTRTLKGHTGFVYSVAYSPDGLHLASVSADYTIRIWDTATGQVTRILKGHTSFVYSVAYSPDGMHLASGSADLTIRIWDTTTGLVTRMLRKHTSFVWSVAYSPDGLHLASGSADETIKIWDTATGQVTRTLKGHTSFVQSVAYSPDGMHLASGSADEKIKIWDTATGVCTRTLKGHTSYVYSVAYSPDGMHLASGSYDKTIKIWDTATTQSAEFTKLTQESTQESTQKTKFPIWAPVLVCAAAAVLIFAAVKTRRSTKDAALY